MSEQPLKRKDLAMQYRVWGEFKGVWFPVSVLFATRRQAERWARSLNTESRIEQEG